MQNKPCPVLIGLTFDEEISNELGVLFRSFGALERHAKNQISTIAGLQMIRGKVSHKERQFWKAVHYGCKVSE